MVKLVVIIGHGLKRKDLAALRDIITEREFIVYAGLSDLVYETLALVPSPENDYRSVERVFLNNRQTKATLDEALGRDERFLDRSVAMRLTPFSERNIGRCLMNNFYTKLPGGMMRSADYYDPAVTDTFREELIELGLQHDARLYTNQRLGQTATQFYDAIDDALRQGGLDITQIEAMNKRIQQMRDGPQEMALREQLEQRIYPIFKQLRQNGYGYYDLAH